MKTPRYHSIATELQNRIKSGEFKGGFKLPSEKELCAEFDVNRHTLRKAIQQLVDSDFLEKRTGKGTYVCLKKITYNMGPSCQFTQTMLSDSQLMSKNIVLELHQVIPLKDVAEKLSVLPMHKVYKIRRLTLVNETPYVITTSYFCSERFAHLTKFIKDGVSLSKVLTERYGVKQRRVSSEFSVIQTKQRHVNILNVEPQVPILCVKNLSVDSNDDPVEYNISEYRGDMASIKVEYCG